ncbi:Glyoxalase/Bleomycin resistance protein/Dihydroxybiphenyl dioxygenase [Immersiella caudata]|uniref:Bleomycin resistance protein n=1 Tax=Immersiella caudata TaxID=314043 RepID=A0AA39WCW5_9PEZI|nr:Glyoxalase/Bleomycin resistance protein/Dihydroxybiphenyl dioxygenase [Immersiella caudata]
MDAAKQDASSEKSVDNLPKFQSVSPVFGVLPENLGRWLEHYQKLGFEVRRYGDQYGFATRDGIQLHVNVNPGHDPLKTAGCAYLYVEDADALHAVWSKVGGAVRHVAPADTGYGLHEGAHIDPDGNLIRFGSRNAGKA